MINEVYLINVVYLTNGLSILYRLWNFIIKPI